MFEIVYHPYFSKMNEIQQPKPFFESYESPLRVRFIWDYLKKIGYAKRDFKDLSASKKDFFINSEMNLVFKQPEPLTIEDINLVHSNYHIELVEQFSKIGSGEIGNLVQATPDTFDLALLSAGGAYEAIFNIVERKYDQSFAIIRPPGHHAIPDASDGLCVFNNIAVSIKKLRRDLEFNEKIAIIDIDTHYGDGIAKIFYEDPSVLYSSMHEFDYDMGEAGFFSEMGAGKGLGYTINYPLPLKANNWYIEQYCKYIEPFIVEFSPDLIIIAAGFDGHFSDPIGNLSFTSQGYNNFAKWLKKLSERVCGGRVCFCLEGGYNLLILPHLIEALICEFIPVKCNPPIDDIASAYFLGNRIKTSENSVNNEQFKKGFLSTAEEFKKKINRILK